MMSMICRSRRESGSRACGMCCTRWTEPGTCKFGSLPASLPARDAFGKPGRRAASLALCWADGKATGGGDAYVEGGAGVHRVERKTAARSEERRVGQGGRWRGGPAEEA